MVVAVQELEVQLDRGLPPDDLQEPVGPLLLLLDLGAGLGFRAVLEQRGRLLGVHGISMAVPRDLSACSLGLGS